MEELKEELVAILPNIKLSEGYNNDLNGSYGGNYYGDKEFNFNIGADGYLSIYYLENFDGETEKKLRGALEKYSMKFSGKDKPLNR